MSWLPIETAPRDGTHILAYGSVSANHKDEWRETYWRDYPIDTDAWSAYVRGDGPRGRFEWYEPIHSWSQGWRPRYWMPLPDPPQG